MEYTRLLRRGMSGADVRYIKDQLVSQGFLATATHGTFGDETLAAVRAFQRANLDAAGRRLAVDGLVGRKTWEALARRAADASMPKERGEVPAHIRDTAAAAIQADLRTASETRRQIVLLGLQFASDPNAPGEYPRSLYIRGGNLYNTDLAPNTIDAARIERGARAQPRYYSGGSKEMMLSAVAAAPATTGADCSGGIVGLMRKLGLARPAFDTTADSLCGNGHSSPVEKRALRPGDFVGRPGHIGLYAGGGYVIEWAGQRYGCQLTLLNGRACYDYVGGRIRSLSPWTKFRDPKAY